MPQSDLIMTIPREWDFLEPAIHPTTARTMHSKIAPAGAGLTVSYPMGQIMRQKTDGTNEWAKIGTSGYTKGQRIVRYPFVIDEFGKWVLGTTGIGKKHEGTIALYYTGYFFKKDLVGLFAGGTNEVQTETVTATGGTRTITVINPVTGVSRTTTALAYNASAATIQAALIALDNVDAGDIVVSGTYVYTFGGNFAGRDIQPLVVNTGSLTGGSSSFAETTPGVDNTDKVGRVVQEDILPDSGYEIIQLGAASLA